MKTWKKAEQRLARLFGAERLPGSGSFAFRPAAQNESKSDSDHATVFLESKHKRKCSIWTLYEETKAKARIEKKIPVIGLFRHASPGVLLVIHSDDLLTILEQVQDAKSRKS